MKIERPRLLEIIKEEIDWARQAQAQVREQEQEEQEEEDPWQKLAGVIQEVEIDPETGKYPPPPEIPDVPSIPENLHLLVIEFIEDMAGLRLKGSDLIARRAKELLAKMEGGGA